MYTFKAKTIYDVDEEIDKGKGFIDTIYYLKDKEEGTVIIIKLKVNGSVRKAIIQIHKRKYYDNLKGNGYKGNILLIGINCDNDNEYTCIIKEYDCDLNFLSTFEYENKSKNKLE